MLEIGTFGEPLFALYARPAKPNCHNYMMIRASHMLCPIVVPIVVLMAMFAFRTLLCHGLLCTEVYKPQIYNIQYSESVAPHLA
jgi:hypothetical protein